MSDDLTPKEIAELWDKRGEVLAAALRSGGAGRSGGTSTSAGQPASWGERVRKGQVRA